MASQRVLLIACLTFLGMAGFDASADTPLSRDFLSAPIAECNSVIDIHLDDAGSIFLVCHGVITTDRTAEFNLYVIKVDRSGQRDTSWDTAGVASFRTNSAVSACYSFECKLGFTGPARDGGFWLALNNGRVVRFLPNGSIDAEYLVKFDGSNKAAEIPDMRFWQLVGVAQQADGGLVSLSAMTGADIGTRTLLVRRLLADGRFGGETTYTQYSTSTIVSWSVRAGVLNLLLKDAENHAPAPLRRAALEPWQGLPPLDQAAVFDPSFYVLGDGKLLFGSPNRIYRWRADGSLDTDFGVPGEVGFRNNVLPSNVAGFYSPYCQPPPLTPRITLRGNGNITHHFSYAVTYFLVPACVGPMMRLLTDNGFNYANAIEVLALPASGLSPYSSMPLRIDREGGLVFPAQSPAREFQLVRADGPGLVGTRARATVRVVEYYNADLDHYFITAHEHEVTFVDRGNAGPGWKRTGHVFGAWNIDTPMPGTAPVCRYYGDPTAGPNSHFYSAEAFECDILRVQEAATPIGQRAWRFERDAFRITAPVNGSCPANLTPVFRLYNRGHERDIDPNHRYVTTPTLYEKMLVKGWAGEGVHMCATHS